ncbi:MAG: hypothetical protein GY708_02175 [Actinomycetia bacterium]|nr:hypothetical protein [Actinomycetes bacterium]MCP4961285.1 hypothetical protein [Actinomycetes bacterium]
MKQNSSRTTLARPALGERAPAVDLTDIDGRTWTLADQRGRTQILIFHRHIH